MGMRAVAAAIASMESSTRETEKQPETRLTMKTMMSPRAAAVTRGASRAEAAVAQRRAPATFETTMMSSRFLMSATKPSYQRYCSSEQLRRKPWRARQCCRNQCQIQRRRKTEKQPSTSCQATPASADGGDAADDDCSADRNPALRSRSKCDATTTPSKTRTTMAVHRTRTVTTMMRTVQFDRVHRAIRPRARVRSSQRRLATDSKKCREEKMTAATMVKAMK